MIDSQAMALQVVREQLLGEKASYTVWAVDALLILTAVASATCELHVQARSRP